MKWLGLFVLGAAIASPSFAAQRVTEVTVGQLAELLSHAHGERDAKLARRLSTLKMKERIGATRFARWTSEFQGRHTRQALTELADGSAFLDLPAADISDEAVPDADALRQIMLRAINYVNKTTRKLPDFYALRTTTSFEDAAAFHEDRQANCSLPGLLLPCTSETQAGIGHGLSGETPLRAAGHMSAMVTYVDGKELDNGAGVNSLSLSLQKLGLVTNGEFGPILTVTLGDALHGKIFWSHWEQGATGLLAVFRYTVPAKDSHYALELPSTGNNDFILPAYHGEITIDPASGNIFRITMIADPEQPNQTVQAAVMVEYGEVVIGGNSYTCPVKGVALSRLPITYGGSVVHPGPAAWVTRLNDITFTRYHLFRAEMKILPGAGATSTSAAPLLPEH